MKAKLATFLGVLIMTGFGSILSRHLGLTGSDGLLLPGFAVGIVMLSQVPLRSLNQRIAVLEKQLAER